MKKPCDNCVTLAMCVSKNAEEKFLSCKLFELWLVREYDVVHVENMDFRAYYQGTFVLVYKSATKSGIGAVDPEDL